MVIQIPTIDEIREFQECAFIVIVIQVPTTTP